MKFNFCDNRTRVAIIRLLIVLLWTLNLNRTMDLCHVNSGFGHVYSEVCRSIISYISEWLIVQFLNYRTISTPHPDNNDDKPISCYVVNFGTKQLINFQLG